MTDDRLHPRHTPPTSEPSSANHSGEAGFLKQPPYPPPEKPVPPPPGTYVVQVPKDQIYKYPPADNSRRYEALTKQKPRRSCCCRCICYTLAIIVVLVIAMAISAGVLYLVFKPESPKYTVSDIAIKNFNISSPSTLSPEFDVTVRAENPNDKIGMYYEKGSIVTVLHSGVNICSGALPVMYQAANNVTVFQTALTGADVALDNAVKTTLRNQQKQGRVLFRLNIEAPVKFKIGAVKTWEITVKVNCDLTVDALTVKSKLVSKNCHYSVRLW